MVSASAPGERPETAEAETLRLIRIGGANHARAA